MLLDEREPHLGTSAKDADCFFFNTSRSMRVRSSSRLSFAFCDARSAVDGRSVVTPSDRTLGCGRASAPRITLRHDRSIEGWMPNSPATCVKGRSATPSHFGAIARH